MVITAFIIIKFRNSFLGNITFVLSFSTVIYFIIDQSGCQTMSDHLKLSIATIVVMFMLL